MNQLLLIHHASDTPHARTLAAGMAAHSQVYLVEWDFISVSEEASALELVDAYSGEAPEQVIHHAFIPLDFDHVSFNGFLCSIPWLRADCARVILIEKDSCPRVFSMLDYRRAIGLGQVPEYTI